VKAALGKGLDALIPTGKGGPEIVELDIKRISPGKEQPRKVFRKEALEELAASIREKGVLQPVLVSRTGDGGFGLIAGERRFRAAQLAGLKKIPAIVRKTDPEDSLEVSLIENIQRENLGPIETAEAFQRLVKEHKYTQEKLASRVGKERATVANYLRLLKLPPEVKALIDDGELGMGHARAILAVEGRAAQVALAERIINEGLSVRHAEALGKQKAAPKAKHKVKKKQDPHVRDLEEKLIRSLGTKVRIRHAGKRGKIEIEYYSLEELDRLLEILL
jgi:ParB family chromosome partitioning protein